MITDFLFPSTPSETGCEGLVKAVLLVLRRASRSKAAQFSDTFRAVNTRDAIS